MGKPKSHPKLTPEQQSRVWAKIERGKPDACWRWLAKAKDRKGRGKVRIDKRSYHVPRLLWELTNGPLPVELKVYETCFNLGCCNPAHLGTGTQSEIQSIAWRHKNGEPRNRKLAQRVDDPQTQAKVYPALTEDDQARFWAKVEKRGADDCWPWLAGCTGSYGYGVLKAQGRYLRAHRLAYILTHGPITPVNRVVRHTCDNPPCCNPSHLLLGTQVNNAEDRETRGNHGNHARGADHPRARLRPADIPKIRKRLKAGEPQAVIAEDYSVCQSTIGDIKLGKTWANA